MQTQKKLRKKNKTTQFYTVAINVSSNQCEHSLFMHFPAAAAVISTIKVRRKKNVFHAHKENFLLFRFLLNGTKAIAKLEKTPLEDDEQQNRIECPIFFRFC